MSTISKVAEKYKQLYNSEPLIIQSPGRINLIGEHTDYNAGLVLPAAIEKYIYMAIGERQDTTVNIYSDDFLDNFTGTIDDLKGATKLWPNYLLGVIKEIQKTHKLSGFNIVFGGDIPISVGLSSSAALTVGTAFALNEVFNLGYSKLEIAKIAQISEQAYVQCGLMDQFVCVNGKKDHLVKLDCSTNEFEHIPFLTSDVKIVLLDSTIRSPLFLSDYNNRRLECQRGIEMVKKHVPEVTGLPDITEAMLNEFIKPYDEVVYKRCLYVVQEIDRVKKGSVDLKGNDFAAFGAKMFETHDGLQNMYEVSCPECDFLIDLVKPEKDVLGARIMGGGFGGCTINLINSASVESVIDKAKSAYESKFKKVLKAYVVSIGNGVEVVKSVELA